MFFCGRSASCEPAAFFCAYPARETWHCHTSHVSCARSVALPHIPCVKREKRGTATHPTYPAREGWHCHASHVLCARTVALPRIPRPRGARCAVYAQRSAHVHDIVAKAAMADITSSGLWTNVRSAARSAARASVSARIYSRCSAPGLIFGRCANLRRPCARRLPRSAAPPSARRRGRPRARSRRRCR